MKCLAALSILLFALSLSAFAQVPTADVIDPQTIVHYIQELQQLANNVQNGIQQLQEADAMVQYQIQALQQLSSGSWQGFVNAWDYETGTLNNSAALASQVPEINDSMDLATFMKTWNAATNVVHSTDYLIKDTQMRQQLWQQQMNNSAASNGPVGQLQAANQALALLGGEVADINMNLGAWKDYFVAREEIQDTSNQQELDIINSYYSTDYLSNTGTAIDLSQQDAVLTQQTAW